MERKESSNKRVYFGVFMIVIGVLWIMERLNLIPDFWNDILISWQMLLIGIGVFSLIGGNKTSGTVLIVIGGFFLLPEMMSIPYELKRIGWPLLIILIGVVLLVTHFGKHNTQPEQPTFDPGRAYGINYFDEFVMFGGREVYIDSKVLWAEKQLLFLVAPNTIFVRHSFHLTVRLLTVFPYSEDAVLKFRPTGPSKTKLRLFLVHLPINGDLPLIILFPILQKR